MLKLTVSQSENNRPFLFKATGINVYSFEEVLYHVYHYWRESVEEFLSDEMIFWVGEIGHPYLSSRMKELAKKDGFTNRVLGFLSLIDYFSKPELEIVKTSLEKWEKRRDWEKLKERADYFTNKNEPAKALPLYKNALQYDDNAKILNNLGVAYLKIGVPKEALMYLKKALRKDPKNSAILFHTIEASILSEDFVTAEKLIKKATNVDPENPDILFFKGLISLAAKDYNEALKHLNNAALKDDTISFYIYKIVDVYLTMRQYDKALTALERVKERNETFYVKEAELYAAWNDIPRAIVSINKAIAISPEAVLYAKLASYYRQDYNPRFAEAAISKALKLDPTLDIVRLENARIKKGLGRTREYQAALTEVLHSFKERYRANY